MLSASEDRERCLLDEVANGNERAYTLLFQTYRPKIYSFIFRISGSAQSAEDVTQDVFAKIWQTRADLVRIKNFNAYIFRIAHNHFLNALKKMAKETLVLQKLKSSQLPWKRLLKSWKRKSCGAYFIWLLMNCRKSRKWFSC